MALLIKSGETGKVLATKYITAMMTLIQCPEQPIYSPRDLHDLDNQPHSVKVHYEESNQQCKVAGRTLSNSSITTMLLQTRLHLDPSLYQLFLKGH